MSMEEQNINITENPEKQPQTQVKTTLSLQLPECIEDDEDTPPCIRRKSFPS